MTPPNIGDQFKLVPLEWLIIVVAASALGRLGKKVGQPLAVGEILAGLLLGPSALGIVWPKTWPPLFPAETRESLQLLGQTGLILLLFQVGMEFDFSHFRDRSHTVISISVAGILAPALGGLCIGGWLHDRFAPQTDLAGFLLCICIALSITALPVLGRILLEMRLERTPLGAMAISAAAIDDVVGWVGLAAVTLLARAKFNWSAVALQAAEIFIFFLALVYIIGPSLKYLWRKISAHKKGMPPVFLIVLLLCLAGACWVAAFVGIFPFFGAFLLGVGLHLQTDLVKAWRELFSNFVMIALVPVYFTTTGLRAVVGSLDTWAAGWGCALVLFTGAAGKLFGCWAAARATGQTKREAFSLAALMNTRALMGLVAINVGYELGLLPRELFTMFVIMSLTTTAMTSPLLRRSLPQELRALVPAHFGPTGM